MTVPTPPVPTDIQSDDQNDIKLVDYLDDSDRCTLASNNTQLFQILEAMFLILGCIPNPGGGCS